MSKLTLGSLFSGSGGFELGGLLCGIEPLWASEVEPFPVMVTTRRLPGVKHLGDINKIDGAAVPPVDIITGGFCCQDLSVAGKRAGLHGERSGLFFEVIRIIKEMRKATNDKYPRFAVLENVPGMYSSNKGLDFLEVLNEIIKIKDETLSVPMPEKGKWSTSGEIVGDGFSLGWRTLDAQFWGVAQRRRRCFIVVDFAGERAGEILFDESRLSGNSAPCECARQEAAGGSEARAGGAVGFEPGACSRLGGHVWSGKPVGALRADMGDNQTAVVYDARGNGCGKVVNTITGDHENRITDYTAIVASFMGGQGSDAGSIAYSEKVAPTLRGQAGGNSVPMVMNERQYALTTSDEVANTLTGTDYKGTQCVFEPVTLKIRAGKEGGGKGPLIQNDKSATLGCSNDQTLFEPKVYGICSFRSHAMMSSNPNSGVYEAETSRTLDTSIPDPNKNAGGMAVVCMEGNGTRPSHKGDGIGEDVSFTLNTVERHSVCYQDKVGSLCASDYKFPQNQQIREGKAIVEQQVFGNNGHGMYNDKPATLKASGGDLPGGENIVVRNRYVVRRLTPAECALLQGFPPDWCAGLETPEPTEDDIAFWSEVWETHRHIAGTSTRPKTRNQIVKWLANPHSGTAEYKLWGNGVALPCVIFVLSGIAYYGQKKDAYK
jgi:DNA (cytosine-5)-methyltransferase 1